MRRRRWFGKAYEDGFASGQRRTRAVLPLLGRATLKCAALHEYELLPCDVDRHLARPERDNARRDAGKNITHQSAGLALATLAVVRRFRR